MISKKTIPITIALMFIFAFFLFRQEEPYKKIPSLRENIKYILYYGDDCSFSRHTLIYLQQNDIIHQYPLVIKEVYYNPKNLEEFYSLQEFCPNIQKKEKVEDISLPVLFLSEEKKCLIGHDFINQYFDKMLQ